LKQEFGVQALRLALENAYEAFPNDFAFALGFRDAFERSEKFVARLDYAELDAELLENRGGVLGFALAHETRINENGVQARAERAVRDYGGSRGIHSAARAYDGYAFAAHSVLDFRGLLVNELRGFESQNNATF